MKNKRIRASGRLVVLVVILLVGAGVLTQAQAIRDYVRLYGYQPSPQSARLVGDTAMTDLGRKLFYVNHPVLASRTSFGQYCSSSSEQSIILGCYHGIDRGIFLFDVTDERLHGVEQVTAAHEMLHAAYDRLSRTERKRIDKLLQDYYKTVTDQRVKDTVAAYEKSEPNDVVNEMHSIFGTEVAVLPPELETYYKAFFSDRSKVVAYATSYQQEFTSRREKVDAIDERLAVMKTSMEANTNSLSSQEAEITTLRRQMEADRNSDKIEAYNAAVPIFNAKVGRYNALLTTIQSQIREYNQLVNERNALALEVKDLARSIDSHLTPIPQ